MTTVLPEIRLETGDPAELIVDVLVVALENRAGSIEVCAPLLAEGAQRSLREAALAVGYEAKREATARVPAPPEIAATSVLFVGLGDTTATTPSTASR